jgi:hypothetical protein
VAYSSVFPNPHPAPDRNQLAQVFDRTLHDLIVLHRTGDVPRARLALAGIPTLTDLEQERARREASRLEATA